jgi:DNA-binding winged helix-turn-helix (wHTH) protein
MRRQLSFGPFTLDPDARQLMQGADQQPVHLSPKAFELLTVLVDARPRAISKQELRDRLWPSTFISEATIASVVAELRDALGERGREGRYVRTLHGFGYSFVASARESAARRFAGARLDCLRRGGTTARDRRARHWTRSGCGDQRPVGVGVTSRPHRDRCGDRDNRGSRQQERHFRPRPRRHVRHSACRRRSDSRRRIRIDVPNPHRTRFDRDAALMHSAPRARPGSFLCRS